ncbi:MAG: ion transporter [Duncaniella sp.]|nr:ion transporter [Duncaniella sp.]MDE6178195.1 ion transporter [Duncaniella sp.]
MSLDTPAASESLKMKLARALDDNLHTRQWHNIVDWLIVAMILISTTEIFLSTFDLDPGLRRVLRWVDIATLMFFTVEVSLRIWVAPCINPEYKGLKGRLRYCFTFYGAIDVLSTFPFYLQWIFPLPVAAFKMLRTARVLRTMRIGRYSKSMGLLSNAIREKRRELIVSTQFLVIITLILSLVLFFAEHEAQPEVYRNGFVSVIWAFAQYIGDPGQFADTPPVTGIGRIIACIVGLLGIAIVAVPAGIIGAGFTEALENEAKKEEIEKNTAKLHNAFHRKLDRPTGYQVVRPFRTLTYIQARLGMKEDDIIEAVNAAKDTRFRLINTGSTIPRSRQSTDQVALEHYMVNRPYGLCIDRNSPVTIVSPSSLVDPGVGNFAFYLALFGGFNCLSREEGDRELYQSVFIHNPADAAPEYEEFAADLRKLAGRHPGGWTFTVLVASGALEPEYPTHIHFGTGGPKGQDDIEVIDENSMVRDTDTYRRFYRDTERVMAEKFGLKCDHQRYHTTANPRIVYRQEGLDGCNHVVLRVEWNKLLWDERNMALCKTLAELIARNMEGREIEEKKIFKTKAIGYKDYLENE